MGLLQIQMRDLAGFRDTRLRILTLRPNSKVHWLTYAVSLHVGGDPNGAAGVLDSYMETVSDDNNNNNSSNSIADFQRIFESSELALYKNMILSEMTTSDDDDKDGLGGIRKALSHLDAIRDVVVDMTGWLTTRLTYQLQLGLFHSAEETAIQLFRRGSTEDHRVHGAYMCALLKCDENTCREVLERSRGTSTLATLRPLSNEERAILMNAYFGASAINEATSNGEDGGGSHEIACISNGSSDYGGGIVAGPGGLASMFPMSASIKRIRLTLLSPASGEFKLAINQYCQHQIIKGVPSLGSDLSSLYLVERQENQKHRSSSKGSSNGKFVIAEVLTTTRYALAKDPVDVKSHEVYRLLVDLVDSYVASLSCNNTFPNDATARGLPHAPSTLLWAWYLRSILHEQAGEYSQGISLINKCIDHTPTAVDFYELKARLLELGGDIQQAADVIDAGRDLDHQDRYINNQATKTLLRAGREGEASKRISLFTRHEAPVEQNLYDMQCTWYELELADCLKMKGELGRSLRKYSKWYYVVEAMYSPPYEYVRR